MLFVLLTNCKQFVRFDFVPEDLPHRAKELKKLDEMYSRVLDSKLARHSLITGQSGYGKTVLSKYFFQNLREDGLQKGINVEFVFVNCKSSHTPTMLMSKVMKDLRMSVGKSQETMNDALKTWLIKNNSRLCVVIDEAHIPLKDEKKGGDRVIYCLSRINEIVSGPKVSVSLCLVSSKDVLSMLEESTRGIFKKNCIIELKGYSREDLKDILVQRVQLAFHPGSISSECLDLLADISSGEGEARYGIELLLNAGLIAQQQGAEEVTAEHIRRAKADILPYLTEELLEELNSQERLTLLSVARSLRKQAYATLLDIQTAYVSDCELDVAQPRPNANHFVFCEAAEAKPLGKTRLRSNLHRKFDIKALIMYVKSAFLPTFLFGWLQHPKLGCKGWWIWELWRWGRREMAGLGG